MKKLIGIFLLALFLSAASVAGAQQDTTTGQKVKTGVRKTGKAIGKGAKKVGKKSAEVGSKSKAKVTDKEIEHKQGPNGESIYQDKNGYYWVDKKGHKHYLPYGQLKDRT